MWNLSRKKVTDECNLAEIKPLPLADLVSVSGKGVAFDDVFIAKNEIQSASVETRQQDNSKPNNKLPSDQNKGKNVDQLDNLSLETANDHFLLYNDSGKSNTQTKYKLDNFNESIEAIKKPTSKQQCSVKRLPSLEVATKDDVDAGSIYSLIMKKDFRYHFQHPYFRMFTAYFVTLCNFLIYAEDPVAHSRSECNIPVIGNDFSFVVMKWFPNSWSILKAFLWISGIIVGLFAGKLIVHTFLFNHLFRLKMFHDDKGTWMTMFLSTVLSVFIFSYLYNATLLLGGDYTAPYRISSYMGVTNSAFMKVAATGTWCGDFFTAWMGLPPQQRAVAVFPGLLHPGAGHHHRHAGAVTRFCSGVVRCSISSSSYSSIARCAISSSSYSSIARSSISSLLYSSIVCSSIIYASYGPLVMLIDSAASHLSYIRGKPYSRIFSYHIPVTKPNSWAQAHIIPDSCPE
ncbi:hypothetical protein Btru_006100 [Bulinus truncatus]|nr:hypothetical protein Btru_006100 [Bulinus truncatus]